MPCSGASVWCRLLAALFPLRSNRLEPASGHACLPRPATRRTSGNPARSYEDRLTRRRRTQGLDDGNREARESRLDGGVQLRGEDWRFRGVLAAALVAALFLVAAGTAHSQSRNILVERSTVVIPEEAGGFHDLEVRLLGPDVTVTVTFGVAHTNIATVSPQSLTFSATGTRNDYTPWQTVRITAVPDNVYNRNGSRETTLTLQASGGNYAGASNVVRVIVPDDDATPLAPLLEGTSRTHKTCLPIRGDSPPVHLDLESSDSSVVRVSPTRLTWTTATSGDCRFFILTAVDNDALGDGKARITRRLHGGNYPLPVASPLDVTVQDNDSPRLLASASEVHLDEGGEAEYSMRLATAPTGEVTVNIAGHSSSDVSITPASLTFNTSTWEMPQTVTVTADHDTDTDDDKVTLVHSASGGGYNNVTADVDVVVTDDEEVKVIVSTGTLPVGEESSNTYTVVLGSQPSSTVTVTITGHSGSNLTPTPATLTFNPTGSNLWSTPQTVTVSASNDVNTNDETTTLTNTASGGGYNGKTGVVVVNEKDNDAPGLVFEVPSVTVTEGSTASYEVRLASEPSGTVTVNVSIAQAYVAAQVTPTTLTFMPANWDQTQTVTVSGVEDNNVRNEERLIHHQSSTTNYTFTSNFMKVSVKDNDTAGLVLSPDPLTIAEGGTASFTVRLTSQPSGSARVFLGGLAGTDVTFDKPNLLFTETTWNQPQTVVLSAGEDADTMNDTATLTLAVFGSNPYRNLSATLDVTVTDNDSGALMPALVLSEPALTLPEGGHGSYTLKLATQPTGTVTVNITGASSKLTLDESSLTFSTTNWNKPQPVTVTAGQDADATDDTVTLMHTASGANYGSVATANLAVSVKDEDAALIVSTPTLGVAEGDTGTFTVQLAGQPSGPVTVDIEGFADTVVTVDRTTLSFSPITWNQPQTVTVTAGEDDDTLQTLVYLDLQAAGGGYDRIRSRLTVFMPDNDAVALVKSTSRIRVMEGGNGSYTMRLSKAPSSTVTVTISGYSETDVTVNPTTLTFNPTGSNLWSTPRTVTVNASEDDDGVRDSVRLSHSPANGGYDSARIEEIDIAVTDNDQTGIVLSSSSLSITEGGSASYTVRLATQPTDDVSVIVSDHADTDLTPDKTNLAFTPMNWNDVQTVTVTAAADGDAVDDTITLRHRALGGGYSAVQKNLAVTIDDTTTAPTVTITGDSAVSEGTAASFTVSANPTPAVNLTVDLTVNQSGDFATSGETGSKTVTIDTSGSATYTVPTVNDDIDEVDGSVTVTVDDGTGYTVGSTSSATVNINDNDTRDLVLSLASLTVPEGASATYTVKLATQPTGQVTVAIDSDNTDVTVSPDSLTFNASGNNLWSTAQTVSVSAEEDNNTAGESVTLTHTTAGGDYGSNSVSKSLAVSVTDNDMANLVFSKGSLTVAEGSSTGSYTVELATQPTAQVTVAIDSNNPDVTVSPTSLTFNASGNNLWSTAQTVSVSATEDDDGANDGATLTHTASGGDYNGKIGTVNVTVTDNDRSGNGGGGGDGEDPTPVVPVVAFAATASSAGEAAGTRTITVTLRPAPSVPLTLHYTLAGTATPGTDYTIRGVPRRTGTLPVPANQSSVTIPVALTDDSTDEPDETIILTLTTGTGYAVGSANAHTLTISGDGDGGDPTPVVAFAAGASSAPEGAGTQPVAVTLAPPPMAALTLTYTVGGTATAGRDHDLTLANSGTVAVPAGSPTATIPVALLDDHVAEEPETVRLTLTDGTGYTLGRTQVHTLTITDNDTAGLRVAPATVHLTEAGETATVTVHLTSQPTAPVTVTLTSSQASVVMLTPDSRQFAPATWQTPQRVTVTAGAGGLTTLTVAVQSHDPVYAALVPGALPRIKVRVVADPTALMTPWLARFGRTVTGQAVTGLTARLAAARTPGLTGTVAGLALDRLGETPATDPARLSPPPGEPQDPRLNPGGHRLSFRDLLAGSAFALTSTPSATGGSYALWGQGAWTRFAGQAGTQNVEGDVLSGTLGVDWAQGPWVLGVAVSHTQGEGDSAGTTHRGELESSLTLVTPYVGLDVTEQVTLWGTLGYGRGTVALTLPTEPEMETDTSLLLAAGGLRGRLLEPAPTGGLALAVRSEARFLRTTAEGVDARMVAESEADVVLVRLGLEGAWQQPLAHGGSVVPRLDLGLRQDAGDAEQGFGVEVRGGVRWEAPAQGLTLDLAGQTLLAHSDQDFETWGGTATLQWDPDPDSAAGPTLALRQTYGDAGSSLGVPHVAYGWAPASRDLALGWRLLPTQTTAVRLDLTATHREAARTAPVQGVALSLTRNW